MTGAAAAWAAQVTWAPPWVIGLGLLALALAAALALHAIAVRLVRRALDRAHERRGQFWRPLAIRTRGPTRLAMVLAALNLAAGITPLPPAMAGLLQHALSIGLILLFGWIALTALDVGSGLYMRRYRVDVEDNLLARKHLTQIRILRRAVATLIVIVTVAMAMMTINGVRQWGVSLLAAGGAAGIIVGLSLQPLLTNLIAGIQIAVTQPMRIDDAVIVENEWGKIEEITATYVVVRLWDWRRLVVPLTYFIQKPFQNWTRESASLIGASMIYVDYSAPVDRLRAKLEEIAKASKLWDGQVVNLAVTDLREQTMELRCLISARNSGDTFDLRCEVREKMIAFLQRELPSALPRTRLEVERPAAISQPAAGR